MDNLSIHASQTNTRPGIIIEGVADGILTDLEGRLTKMTGDGFKLPETVKDIALFNVLAGAADEGVITVAQLSPNTNMRVRAQGAGSKGDVLVLSDPTASSGVNAGKVEAIGSTEGAYFSPGVADEDFVDEQLVKIRPHPRLVHVGSAFTVATPAATAATSTTPFGFSEAQANAILTNVRELRAWAVAQGFKATA